MKNRGLKIQNETLGFLWLTFGVLTLLSLFSYDPNDTGFFSTHPNPEITNFVGPVGAYWSGGLFLFFGVGAYMVPVVMFIVSIAMFLQKEIDWLAKILWCGAYFVSLSSLLDLQTFLGRGLNLLSSGGIVGSTMDDFFTKILGMGGWTILMVALFIVSTIFLFGLHPMKLAVEFQSLYQQWKEEREERKLLASGEEGELELKRRRLKEQMERIKKSIPIEEQGELRKAAPQVVDTTQKSASVEKKAKAEKLKEEKPKENAPIIDTTRKSSSKSVDKKQEIPAVSRVLNLADYQFPSKELLEAALEIHEKPTNEKELQANSALLVAKLKEFGIDCAPGTITKGTTITRYELFPAAGVRVDRIKSVQNDIALAMKAERVNILAPIPGKDTVGVEIPNTSKVAVRLKDLFESDLWINSKARIPLAIGKDIYGNTMIADLAEMPHLLVAGTTGSGKSVVINCILLSLLYRFNPEELKLILVDPKVVEMQMYNPIPHLITDVVTDPKNVLKALRQVVFEMERRYQILAKVGVKNIVTFNNRPKSTKPVEAPPLEPEGVAADEDLFGEKITPRVLEIPDKLSYWVVVIDELADLMQTASAEVEALIARITQKARAAGIHLIVATQTPRREVVTGVIKANIPSRIALQVTNGIDSRVILDDLGAENLLGKGDLLYLSPGASKASRGQGAFVSEEEVHRVIDFIAAQVPADRNSDLHKKLNSEEEQEALDEESLERLKHCYQIMRAEKKISASFIQRRMSIGYNTAARLIEVLEKRGVIGEADSNNPTRAREILIDLENPPKWLL